MFCSKGEVTREGNKNGRWEVGRRKRKNKKDGGKEEKYNKVKNGGRKGGEKETEET